MKHPLRSTGEAGIEPALTVLETAFLPLEDSPLNMSRRGLLPDPFAVLTHPQNRIYYVADWNLFGSRSFIARYAHDFMTSVSQMPGQAFQRSREQAHGSLAVLSCRLPSYLVKPSSD